MPLFCTPCSDYPGVKRDFFYCPYLIISSSFSGNANYADEVFDFMRESISVFFTPKQVRAFGFVKNLPLSVPASVFIPEKLASAKHYLSLPLKLDHS
jgi:hypothetical protein